jgi:multiple sugar transport system permease protein
MKSSTRTGLLFISPWLIGFCVFTLFPFAASFYFSFCWYDGLKAPEWIGLENYRRLLFHEPLFWKSVYNTLYYAAFSVPLGICFGLGIALLLNMNVRGISIYRTIFFLSSIVPAVASSVLWMWLLNPQFGIINTLLRCVGINGPGWIASPAWSKPAMILMGLWGVGGTMVIYLAGLQNIPESLYEAAELDGAGALLQTVHITLPILTPVIFFNLVMGLIGAFQYFTQAFVMTHGGPVDSTLFYNLYLFNEAFAYLNFGYASALAWVLFLFVCALTLIVFKTQGKWVHYAD